MGYGFPFPVSLQPVPVLRACSALVPGQPLCFWAERRRTGGCRCSVAWSHPTLQPHELQHARLPSLSPSPRVCSDLHPLSQWCYPTISSSVIPFPPSIFPSIRVFSNELALRIRWPKYWSFSFSISSMNIQGWFPLQLIGWISLQSKELSRVFSSTRGSGTGKQARARSQRHPHQTPETTQAPSLGTCLRSDSRTNLASAYLWFPSLMSPRGGSFLEMTPAQLPCLFLQVRVTWWMRQEKAPVWWADFPQDPRILSIVQWAGPWSEDVHTLILRTQGCSLTGKEELCRRDWGEGLEMRRASWTVQVVPVKRDLYL